MEVEGNTHPSQEQAVDSKLNAQFAYRFSYPLILRCLRGSCYAFS